jgi:hypothetical protein
MEVSKLASALNSHFRHSSIPLETFNGLWDIWWALWIIVFGVFALECTEYAILATIFPSMLLIGIPILAIGVLQLWAVQNGSKSLRSNLALLSAIGWITILTLIVSVTGSLAGPYVVNYGMAAVGEVWVFLRLTRPWA